jgi:inner membrane protein
MIDWAGIAPAWAWVIAGLVAAVGEVLLPGIFLIWLGLAAIATGLLAAAVDLTWPVQLVAFAIFALLAVLAGRRLARHPVPDLNRRGHDLVGRTFSLDAPLHEGTGRLRQGDTSWRVVGPDLPAGARVRVVRLDGTTLVVEPATE